MHILVAFLTLLGISTSFELYGTSQYPRQVKIPVDTFNYDGPTGPLNWYGLNKTYAPCSKGKRQSPIDLKKNLNPSVKMIPGSSVKVDIPNVDNATFENLGATVEIPMTGTLTAMGKTYKLVQFHYHTPGEHRVDNEYYMIEQHFVFEAKDGAIAVMAFLVELSETEFSGPLLREVFSRVTDIAKKGSSTTIGPLNFVPLMEHFHGNPLYHYIGSISTPPCTEPISWFISTKLLHINATYFLAAKSIMKFNSRYTQDYLGDDNLLENAAHELQS